MQKAKHLINPQVYKGPTSIVAFENNLQKKVI